MEIISHRNIWTDSLILRHHYSKRIPIGICFTMSIRNKNKIMATCYFSNMTAGHWGEDIIELSRLVKLNSFDYPLTQLISKSLKKLKKRGFDLVISYADSQQNHHGGIYQAASWNYHGIRGENSVCGYTIDGAFFHRRSLYSQFGSSSEDVIKKIKKTGKKVKKVKEPGKHLYWKALNKKGKQKAKKLLLNSIAYPKPGKIEKEKFTHLTLKNLRETKMKGLS